MNLIWSIIVKLTTVGMSIRWCPLLSPVSDLMELFFKMSSGHSFLCYCPKGWEQSALKRASWCQSSPVLYWFGARGPWWSPPAPPPLPGGMTSRTGWWPPSVVAARDKALSPSSPLVSRLINTRYTFLLHSFKVLNTSPDMDVNNVETVKLFPVTLWKLSGWESPVWLRKEAF